MNLKQRIEQDLKSALIAGDKQQATLLRGLKSSILYVEVESGKREAGLSDDEVIGVLAKEAKKRQESANLYKQGGDEARAEVELSEKSVIERYLPEQLGEDEISKLIDAAESAIGEVSSQTMGQIIGYVKKESKGAADGAIIARLVSQRMK